MSGPLLALLAAIALNAFGSAIWDGIKFVVRRAWPRRQRLAAGVRRLVVPRPDVQLRRVVAGLVATLVVATAANVLPPAVLNR